jgi:three-Cys-motif partner protein
MTHGVVKKWEAKLAYVDLFAGPGRSIIRDTGEEVEGSPVLSLKYEFAKYIFVDKPEVLSSLSKQCRRRAMFSRTRSARQLNELTNQPRKCRSDTIMARILAEKTESSCTPSH